MNMKKVLPLVAAMILGLIAARMVVSVVQRKNSSEAVVPNLPKVVVAKLSLDAGEKLTVEELALGQLAPGAAGSAATFTDPSELIGRVTTAPVVEGQAITAAFLAPKGSAAGLTALIPNGMRALTVEINEITGIAGYLTAGCHVDMLETLHDEKTGEVLGRTIVQNIQISQIGQKHAAADEAGAQVRSVTLLVTPRQAEEIELASMSGRPRLVLRGATDRKVEDTEGVYLSDLRGKRGDKTAVATVSTTQPSDPFAGPATRPSAPTEWAVRMITGGEPSVVKVKLPPAPEPATVTNTDQDNTVGN